VPLERKTVRFIDNFSTGLRGAICAEYFLRNGYAVLFLYRKGSCFPFLRHFPTGPALLSLLRPSAQRDVIGW